MTPSWNLQPSSLCESIQKKHIKRMQVICCIFYYTGKARGTVYIHVTMHCLLVFCWNILLSLCYSPLMTVGSCLTILLFILMWWKSQARHGGASYNPSTWSTEVRSSGVLHHLGPYKETLFQEKRKKMNMSKILWMFLVRIPIKL